MVTKLHLTRRVALVALAAGALAACGAGGSRQDAAPVDFARPVAALPPIPAGQSRIVIMREDWAQSSGPTVEVLFNEKPVGMVADGKLLSRDVAPGFYRIGVAPGTFDELGVTEAIVEVRPGASAYVRMTYYLADGKSVTSTALAPSTSARRGNTQLNQASSTTRVRNFRFAELPGPPR